MGIIIRKYKEEDLPRMAEIWNHVVEEANAFPQEQPLKEPEGRAFFAAQSFCGVAEKEGEVIGLYILHPNNVGRCGHISNASYAVAPGMRGLHIGEQLVRDSMAQARTLGFRILQFNAVVATNKGAIHLYERLGFRRLGLIKGGFRGKDGSYEDIIPFYIEV